MFCSNIPKAFSSTGGHVALMIPLLRGGGWGRISEVTRSGWKSWSALTPRTLSSPVWEEGFAGLPRAEPKTRMPQTGWNSLWP